MTGEWLVAGVRGGEDLEQDDARSEGASKETLS